MKTTKTPPFEKAADDKEPASMKEGSKAEEALDKKQARKPRMPIRKSGAKLI